MTRNTKYNRKIAKTASKWLEPEKETDSKRYDTPGDL